MPNLTPATEALRITQAAQAFSLMAQGLSQKAACEKAGITPDQFRHWLGREHAALTAIRDTTVALERENLAQIISARAAIVRRLLEIVTSTPLPAKDLVAVDQHLAVLQETLENKYGTQSHDTDAENFLKLTGPSLRKQDSNFSAKLTQTTIEVNNNTIRQEDIVDSSFIDREEETDL